MDKDIKLLLFATITAAVFFGFIDSFTGAEHDINFAALHVFLFNLTSGGLLITTYLREKKGLDTYGVLFYAAALLFSMGAAFDVPPVCIVSALVPAAMVESVRWKRFGWFPADFFRNAPVSLKFQQASLLCLSMGLAICAATLINNEYLNLFYLKKLDLHVFFLGFSFPISLIIFSTIFERIESSAGPPPLISREFCFWAINLGVIFFFFFIIFEIYSLQLVAAILLFSATCLTIFLHLRRSKKDDQRMLLSSALAFLALGSVTGIMYVVYQWKFADYMPGDFLGLHSAATIFGWNLTWILLAARKDEYPIKVRTPVVIAAHWLFVLLIPSAKTSALFAVFATLACVSLLAVAFFTPSRASRR